MQYEGKVWCAWMGSNHLLPPYKGGTLTDELQARLLLEVYHFTFFFQVLIHQFPPPIRGGAGGGVLLFWYDIHNNQNPLLCPPPYRGRNAKQNQTRSLPNQVKIDRITSIYGLKH